VQVEVSVTILRPRSVLSVTGHRRGTPRLECDKPADWYMYNEITTVSVSTSGTERKHGTLKDDGRHSQSTGIDCRKLPVFLLAGRRAAQSEYRTTGGTVRVQVLTAASYRSFCLQDDGRHSQSTGIDCRKLPVFLLAGRRAAQSEY
ncbi:hypothetical protein BaRGS_00030244, partial [Batillaria attramentaria]